jgi:uncharacterized damage-inducible protein DinB
MNYKAELIKEMENEAVTTRKMLSIIPQDKYTWKPHEKSMSLISLATHIAEIPQWAELVVHTDEMDFEKTPYVPKVINNNHELLNLMETSLKQGKAAIESLDMNDAEKTWTIRSGEQIFNQFSKADNIRHTFCQVVHHRAQLGVYLRLLNIPIPGSYGPSADSTF